VLFDLLPYSAYEKKISNNPKGEIMDMNKPKDVRERTQKKVTVDEFWCDPMNFPAFMKPHDDKTPLV